VDARTESFEFFGTRTAAGLEIPDRQEGLGLVEFGFSRQEGKESGNRFRFRLTISTSKRQEAHESIGCGRPRFAAVRISAESNALELRGIVTSRSSELEHAMSETA
jgi:hypothetical protein